MKIENIINEEQNRSFEIEKKLFDFERKIALVKKVNLFSGDEEDEFRVVLKNGKSVGIFKTWAVPAIPILEQVSDLSNLDWKVIDGWAIEMQQNPVLAWESLEKWRSRTEIDDRRLLKIFNERKLPFEKEDRVAELFVRMKSAFAFASPFYHIEAMVGDGKETPGNPFSGDLGKESNGGFLDMAGMLLPSALGKMVKADRLNWNGLSWKNIEKQIESNTDLEKMAILMRVARMAGIKTEEVLFAANALEWIPVSVGGKKGDLPEEEAKSQLTKSVIRSGDLTIGTVARDMNGLVRFLNWTPLIKDEINFSEAGWWKYSAVCETSNKLIKELSDGKCVCDEHREEFVKTVLPQLTNLDASSARGRFVLWMFENGWFKESLLDKIDKTERKIEKEIIYRMVDLEQIESVVELGSSNNRFLVGGKAAGLLEASEIFGKEFVGDGVVITSEAVSRWLGSNELLMKKIRLLDKENEIGKKLKIASEVRVLIERMTFPKTITEMVKNKVKGDLLAIRSSSFDEDTLVNGSAAGIYGSEVGIEREELGINVVRVVESFFSEKAVSYRHMHGLTDNPIFSVIVHEFLPGAGGVVFSKGDGDSWTVFTGETPGHIVGGEERFDQMENINGRLTGDLNNGWVSRETVEKIGNMAVLAEHVLGGMTDMEFVVSAKGLRILQLRMLNSAEEKNTKVKEAPKRWFALSKIENLGSTVFEESSVGLIIGEGVNIEQFQGELFRCLIKNKDKVSVVSLGHKIPRTSHFANICLNLGIKLVFRDE